MSVKALARCAAAVLAVVVATAAASPNSGVEVVDLLSSTPTLQTQIAVQACAGLTNRRANSSGVFVNMDSSDPVFLKEVAGVETTSTTQPAAFVSRCLNGDSRVAAGVIVYNYTAQKALMPVIITMAGVLNAVPLEANDPAGEGLPVVFNAASHFAGYTALNATAYVYDRFGNQTTALAFMDPGYDQKQGGPFKPTLSGNLRPSLIDFIVKEKLFNFYLVEACIPLTQDHALLQRMVSEESPTNSWPRPIPAYGYDDTFNVLGGDLFEAGTTCVKEHNLGTIASDSVDNLSFYSRKPPVTEPMVQVPSPPITYNASKSYVTFVIGDGDNVGFIFGARFDWMRQRVQSCANGTAGAATKCYPMVWTLSPHLPTLSPDMMRWFYSQTHATGADYFMMPPSGILYSYPSQLNAKDQATFVRETEAAARLMNTSSTVDWEFAFTWGNAIDEFFPLYATNNVVRGVFPVNVPFMFPVLKFFDNKDKYIIVKSKSGGEGDVVVFQPREWRGTNATGAPPFSKQDYLTAAEMASELNGNPAGTVSYIYLTSDGGASWADFDRLAELLEPHVEVVDANALVSLARQRSGLKP